MTESAIKDAIEAIQERDARIAALEAKLAERVKVKPLRWKSRPTRPTDIFCDTNVGQYSIGNVHGTTMVILRCVKKGQDYDEVLWEGLDNGLAKAAAQADFERRVLSALEATPPAPKVTKGALPQDVIDLVIAAREYWDANDDLSPESRALDHALEEFASRVPYADEPGSLTAAQEPAPKVTEAMVERLSRYLSGNAGIDPNDPLFPGSETLSWHAWQDEAREYLTAAQEIGE